MGTGAALAAIHARQVVALEVHAIDPEACCGWSVNVVGTPTEIRAALADAAGQDLRSPLRP